MVPVEPSQIPVEPEWERVPVVLWSLSVAPVVLPELVVLFN
jgi:hypothetical protein